MSRHAGIRSSGVRGLSSSKIIERILSSAVNAKLQSELLNETLVSRTTLSRYISHLLSNGLLEQVDVEGRTKLKTTRRGIEQLNSSERSSSAKSDRREDEDSERNDRNKESKGSSSKEASSSFPNWDIAPSAF